MGTLLAFIGTTWLLAMLPGMVQALLVRQTLLYGRLVAFATIAGTSTGLLLWSVAAAAGLSAILLTNEAVYTAARWAGGAFLAYVGLKGLLHGPAEPSQQYSSVHGPHGLKRRAFLTGLATNLGNPKAGMFAISLLPQFAPQRGNIFLATASLGLLWALVAATWYSVFVYLVDRTRAWMTSSAAQLVINRITGMVLIALGVGVAFGD